MRRSAFALIALAACAEPLAPIADQSPPDMVPVRTRPAPVLRFVGVCDHPAIWWLRRDPASDAPAIWLFTQTDSVEYPADTAFTGLHWLELDGAATPIASGVVGADSIGAGRAVAECLR